MNYSIENITNEGQPLSEGDRYKKVYVDGTMSIHTYKSIIVAPESNPNNILHKAWFKERLLPFAEDIRAARQADATVDAYFDLLSEYSAVDVSWDKTIIMLHDAEARIKVVVPSSTISAADLLLPQQEDEVYR